MGLHAIVENNNRCQVGYARKSVYPSQNQCSEAEDKDEKNKPIGRNRLPEKLDPDLRGMHFGSSSSPYPRSMPSRETGMDVQDGDVTKRSSMYQSSSVVDADLRGMCFSNSSSPYRRSMPSRPFRMHVQDDEVTRRRGSVYQRSSEVRKMKKLQEDRIKIKFDGCSEDFLSFEIVNSSLRCQGERQSPRKKNMPQLPFNERLSLTSQDTTGTVMTNSSDFLDLSFCFVPEEQCTTTSKDSQETKKSASDDFLEIPLLKTDLSCRPVANLETDEKGALVSSKLLRTDDNLLLGWDKRHFLTKSFSAKMRVHNSLNQSDDAAFKISPKSRLGPGRGMLDPIMKSKSQRNPSFSEAEVVCTAKNDPVNVKRNKESHKSMLNNFSWATKCSQMTENDSRSSARDQGVLVSLSPVHLNGIMKLEKRDGVMSFEFHPSDSEDFLSAKAWTTNGAFRWIYTFHRSKKKNSGNAWGMKNRSMLPSLIGQMKVACCLCSEINNNQLIDNSMVMECTLYDIAQARRAFACEGKSHSAEAFQPLKDATYDGIATAKADKENDLSKPEECEFPSRHVAGDGESDASNSCPWVPADLLPYLEIAAIVIQFPHEKKGSLKSKKEDKAHAKEYRDLCSVSTVDQRPKPFSSCLFSANMKVIIPSGCHGLPFTEGCPSPLLNRWRSGGVCDCGGWDMGCPIVVLDKNNRGHAAGTNHQCIKLFTQGSKDSIPDFTMTSYKEGQFSVQFHAKLSALQAFSICVAMLHALEPSTMTSQETSIPTLHAKSLKLLLDEEVRNLFGTVTEKRLKAKHRIIEPMATRHVLGPPFSPIARV